MQAFVILLQIAVALGILNVWILRREKTTAWRPEGARNMEEEFRHYGLPEWMLGVVGFTKVLLAVLLLLGIWYTPLAVGSASLMAVLMLAAVLVHLKVHDPLVKAMPAFCLFLMSLVVTLTYLMT